MEKISNSGELAITEEEKRLVSLSKKGDGDAFGQIVLNHWGNVFGTCYYLIGNKLEAEDLSQHTFMKAWEAIPRYNHIIPISFWLNRIAHNTTNSHLRKKNRSKEIQLDNSYEGISSSRNTEPHTQVEDIDNIKSIVNAMSLLSSNVRQAIDLYCIQELDYQKTAEIMGKSVNAVRVLVYRGRNSLKVHLRELTKD